MRPTPSYLQIYMLFFENWGLHNTVQIAYKFMCPKYFQKLVTFGKAENLF